MNLAAILPRFPHVGFQPRRAPRGEPSVFVLPQQSSLPARAIMTLENRRLQLRVLLGCVWITRDGSLADVVLGPGEVFEQRPGARVLVQALERAELLIAVAGGRR